MLCRLNVVEHHRLGLDHAGRAGGTREAAAVDAVASLDRAFGGGSAVGKILTGGFASLLLLSVVSAFRFQVYVYVREPSRLAGDRSARAVWDMLVALPVQRTQGC